MQTQTEIQKHLDIVENSLQRERLRKMQWVAGALLIAALALFILAQVMHGGNAAWGYVAAFAEAAMIGAMADWFAVVALFRHPLGVPIWHTAIIPNSKDDIGRSLGAFVENHFITEEAIAGKLRQADIVGKIGAWLLHPENTKELGITASAALKKLLNTLDDQQISEFIQKIAKHELGKIDLSGIAGQVIDSLVTTGKHQELLDTILDGVSHYLGNEENQPSIQQFLISSFQIDNALAKMALSSYAPKAIASLNTSIASIQADSNHVLRLRFNEWIEEFVLHLKADPEWQKSILCYQRQALSSKEVQGVLAEIWGAIKNRLLADINNGSPASAAHIDALALKLGKLLITDEPLKTWLNNAIEAGSSSLIRKYRGEVGHFIEQQLAQWTKEEMTQRIELAIGRDLQFIRINGTLVGGLIGLLIYTLVQFVPR